MTVREEAQWCIRKDGMLAEIRKKIRSGKATYEDTAAYSARAGKMIGALFSRRLPEIPPEEREQLCVDLLHDQYIDINAAVDAAQRYLDERLGIQLAPQHAPFDSERGHQIGSSLRDLSKPVETLQRRAKAATETTVKSMHDDRMKTEAKFRSRAGLNCFITRKAVSGCCAWCTAMAGRFEYGEEPDDIYRRHDNCDCTVTFENGRKRQDVWSKREWEAPEPGAGAGDPVVLTEEQARELEANHLPITNQSRGTRLFNDFGVSSNAPISSQSIIEDLKSSSTGREILDYIEKTEEIFIRLDNDTVRTDFSGRPIYGEEKGGEIVVYLLMCEDSERAARTVIHECTHRRYGIGQSQWAECVCFAQELKHKYKRDTLTYSEKKRIIEAVQEGYPEYKWRKGGLIYGKRQNHT